jgi:hypothetical protein
VLPTVIALVSTKLVKHSPVQEMFPAKFVEEKRNTFHVRYSLSINRTVFDVIKQELFFYFVIYVLRRISSHIPSNGREVVER